MKDITPEEEEEGRVLNWLVSHNLPCTSFSIREHQWRIALGTGIPQPKLLIIAQTRDKRLEAVKEIRKPREPQTGGVFPGHDWPQLPGTLPHGRRKDRRR